jgi:uncharacterized membrane protein YukC
MFIDYQITGFKWSAIGIAIALVILFIAALAYRLLVQNRRDRNVNGPNSDTERLNKFAIEF